MCLTDMWLPGTVYVILAASTLFYTLHASRLLAVTTGCTLLADFGGPDSVSDSVPILLGLKPSTQ